MTDKEKIEKLKRRFRKDTPGLFPGNGKVDPVSASLSTRGVPIYCTANPNDRRKVRDFLRNETCDLIRKCYHRKVADKDHTGNIAKLAAKVGKKHGKFLHEGRFRFGIAQKYLNLKLKGLWVLGKIPTPPHCPFDGVVLNKILWLGLRDGKTWTASDSRPEYNKWVKAAQKEANNLEYPKILGYSNIAVWELAAYTRYQKHGLPIQHWQDVK